MIPAMSDLSDEETDNPVYADEREFYKVEKWTMDGLRVDSLLYAGNNLGKARDVFRKALNSRPPIRLSIRQRTQTLACWPVSAS
jgi:hypothetical protein